MLLQRDVETALPDPTLAGELAGAERGDAVVRWPPPRCAEFSLDDTVETPSFRKFLLDIQARSAQWHDIRAAAQAGAET